MNCVACARERELSDLVLSTLINRDIRQCNQMARYVSIAFNNPWKDFSFLNTSLMILNTFPHSTMQHIHCMVLIHQMNHAQMPFAKISLRVKRPSRVPRPHCKSNIRIFIHQTETQTLLFTSETPYSHIQHGCSFPKKPSWYESDWNKLHSS
jgi:hypothetical protein